MNVEEEFFDSSQGYEARGIVARIQPAGFYQNGALLRLPIYRYLTLDCGKGRKGIAVKLVGQAAFIERNGERYLDASKLKEGQIIVEPGFIYQKTTMTGALMAEHLKALKTYRRKTIIKADRDTGGDFDLGVMDFTKNQITKDSEFKDKILH